MKRVFSFLLVLLLVAGLVPVQARAISLEDILVMPWLNGEYASSIYVQPSIYGDTVTLTCDGYSITGGSLYSGDGDNLVGSFEGSSFVFPANCPSVTVWVSLTPSSNAVYEITTSTDGNGSIDVTQNGQAVSSAEKGAVIQVATTANADYELYTLTVTGPDNVAQDIKESKTFKMPEGAVTVTATFKPVDNSSNNNDPVRYSITTEAENGTIKAYVDDTVVTEAAKGDEVTVTATAAEGYELDTLTVTGPDKVPADIKDTKTFIMPEGAVTVTATFKPVDNGSNNNDPVRYSITTEAENGTVKAYVDRTVVTEAAKGDEVTVTAMAAEGYELDTLTVVDTEGTPVTVTGNKFVMPDDNVTVNVTFRQIGSGGGNQDGGDQGGTEGGQNIIVEHITEPEQNNSYGAKLDMTDGDILDKFLGDEAATEDTQVWMTVAKLADAPSTEKQAIEAMAASDKLATYLDIKLFKKVGNRNAEMISNTHGPVTITMTLDAGVVPANAESVYIVYYHGGAKTIPASYNHSTRVLTFQASEFSTYALAYKVGAAATASVGVLDNVPKTGDSAPLMSWTMLVLCSTAMLAAVAVFDKKRAR